MCVQEPTPHTPPLQSFLVDFLSAARRTRFSGLRALGASMPYAVQALTHKPTRGSRSPPKKVCNLDPMAPVPVKTPIEGPPVVAVAVSLDPILPHR